jgi:hypothetical protein
VFVWAARQGDQMSFFEKIAPNVAQPIFVKMDAHITFLLANFLA